MAVMTREGTSLKGVECWWWQPLFSGRHYCAE